MPLTSPFLLLTFLHPEPAPESSFGAVDKKAESPEISIVHSLEEARLLETPPEVSEEAKPTTERKVG